jgi:hypothetical protein
MLEVIYFVAFKELRIRKLKNSGSGRISSRFQKNKMTQSSWERILVDSVEKRAVLQIC